MSRNSRHRQHHRRMITWQVIRCQLYGIPYSRHRSDRILKKLIQAKRVEPVIWLDEASTFTDTWWQEMLKAGNKPHEFTMWRPRDHAVAAMAYGYSATFTPGGRHE